MSARIVRVAWGQYTGVGLDDGTVGLLLVPDLGARVISLLDRRSGREWLVGGAPPGPEEAASWAREEVVFDGRTSFGWDECLPTVAPCPDPVDLGAPPLRDHGDQWARPAVLAADEDAGALTVTWTAPRWAYAFRRRLTLPGDGMVLAEYALESLASAPLPILWSMHPVLRLEPGTLVELPGVADTRLTWVGGLPVAPAERMAWPIVPLADGRGEDLSCVRTGEGWAAKLYAEAPEVVRAVCPDGAALELSWDRATVPTAGIWLSAGGWPVGGPPAEQTALEPTTSPDDHLADAMAHDRELRLEPGETRSWWVRLTLRPPQGRD